VAGAIDPLTAREVYGLVAREEPAMRTAAAHAFPSEPWSQDDDFHGQERKKLRGFAGQRQLRVEEVLRAVDDGMHAGWPAATIPNPRARPCRPRLDY
jgi:hypothetical protein